MSMQDIKNEILGAVKDSSLIALVKKELDLMEVSEGLDDKSILLKFHSLWKSSDGKKGHKNDINSWTAYAIGMTDKKPEDNSEFLPKRRVFARKGFPDIDSDFDFERRDEIYKYIIDRYGRENVGNIGTYNALKMKSFLRRAVKAIDPERTFFKGRDTWKEETNKLGDEIIKSLPKQFGAFLKVRDEEGKEHAIKTVEDAYKWCKDFKYYIDKYPELLKNSKNIEGLLSIFGVHPAGIVLSNEPLSRIAPLRQSKIVVENSENGEAKFGFATQFENGDLEFLGLIKFDILALSTLSVINRCLQMIKEHYNIDINIWDLPLNDKKTFQLYKQGKLVGVFQCEERGMQETMINMGVDSLDDIMAGIALYRPGPLQFIPKYCARKHGTENIDYFHPSIQKYVEPYLKKTYAIICYQEQVMQICNSIAGFSIPEGYTVIKAIGKKKPELLAKYRTRFISGAKENNIEENVAADYWDKVIMPFADYGFNKAHACCYAYNSYITAYLKANFPEEFLVSYLNVETARANYDKIAILENEAKNMNIEILPRQVNECKMEYEIKRRADPSNGIYTSQISPPIRCKGLSEDAAKDIVSKQPYSSLRDFTTRTDSKVVDRTSVEAMLEAGFFRPRAGYRAKKKEEILKEFEVLREDLKKAKKKGVLSGNLFEE